MLAHHFGSGWSGAIAPPASSRFQQRLRERSRTAVRHDGHPPTEPCCPGTRLMGDWFGAGFCLGELPQERLCLRGPPPTHFASEDKKLCPAKSTSQLGMVRVAPSSLTQRGRGKPSRPIGDANVVSMASCAT